MSFHVVLNFVPKIEEAAKPLYETNTVIKKAFYKKKNDKEKKQQKNNNRCKKLVDVSSYKYKVTVDSDWIYE